MRHVDPNPRCVCGKVIYLHQERAAFAAVQTSAFYGVAMLPYQCRVQERFWHIQTVRLRKDIRHWKKEVGGAKEAGAAGGGDL